MNEDKVEPSTNDQSASIAADKTGQVDAIAVLLASVPMPPENLSGSTNWIERGSQKINPLGIF